MKTPDGFEARRYLVSCSACGCGTLVEAVSVDPDSWPLPVHLTLNCPACGRDLTAERES